MATAEPTPNLRSCHRCNRKKIRCDKSLPCRNCVLATADCVFPPPGRAPRRKKRPLKAELVARLRHLEQEVQSLSQGQTGQSPAESVKSTPEGPDVNQTDTTPGPTINKEEKAFGRLVLDERKCQYVSHQDLASLGDQINELRDLLDSPSPASSSGDDDDRTAQSNSRSAFLFGYHSLAHSLSSYHPSAVESQVLWDAYEANVAPLVPIVHKATMRNTIKKSSTNSEYLDKPTEAFVFSVYFAALVSMKPQQCQLLLQKDHAALVEHYRFATEQALARAEFLHTRNMTVLQAAVLFLTSVRGPGDTQLVWTMTAVVYRLGQALGLHRDGSNFGLSPFETEMRRRLWWHIFLLDMGSSEHNATGPQIQEGGYDTKLPLNINDEDISLDSAEAPEEHVGFTEITTFLIRCEFARMFRQLRQKTTNCADGSISSLEEYEQGLTELSRTLEQRRLRYCDLNVPIHWVAATISRIALARAWLVAHFSLMKATGLDAELWQEKRERLFLTAIEVVEFAHLLETSENTAKWSWFFETYMQWHAFAFLLSEICISPVSPMTDKAWMVADMVYRRWKGESFQKSGMLWRPLSRLMKRTAAIRARRLAELNMAQQTDLLSEEFMASGSHVDVDVDATIPQNTSYVTVFNEIVSELGL